MEPKNADTPRPASPHPTDDALERFSLGHLREEELEEIEEHLLVCHACQDAAQEVDGYVRAMKAALRQPPAPSRWSVFLGHVRPPKPLAFGAALAALSLAVAVSYTRGTGEPAHVELRAMRGDADLFSHGPADAPLNLTVNSESVKARPDHRVRIVDARGKEVWSGTPAVSGEVHVAEPLGTGLFWVRLYDRDRQLLQEYGLRLE